MNPLLIAAAILPGLLICLLIFWLDKYERESFWALILTFCLGMLSGLPAIGLQMLAANYGLDNQSHLGWLLFYVFIVIAFSEELVKLLMVLVYPYRQPFFNEPMDGIVYSTMVGMGFAVVENLIYAYNFGLETILVRAFTAVPSHAVFAAFLGYFVGLSKFHPNIKGKLIAFGFLAAVMIHGLYDFFILQQYYDWLMGLGLVTVMVGIYLSWLLIKDHRNNSPFKATVQLELEEATEEDLLSTEDKNL